jgi:hypothetical protein
MMDEVVYRCRTKATDKEGDHLRLSVNWAFARRGELRLTRTAIECGDWTIPYDTIDDAALIGVPTNIGNAYTLRVKSMDKTYQFQLKSISSWRWVLDPFWLGPTPMPLRRVVGRFEWKSFWIAYIRFLLLMAILTVIGYYSQSSR